MAENQASPMPADDTPEARLAAWEEQDLLAVESEALRAAIAGRFTSSVLADHCVEAVLAAGFRRHRGPDPEARLEEIVAFVLEHAQPVLFESPDIQRGRVLRALTTYLARTAEKEGTEGE